MIPGQGFCFYFMARLDEPEAQVVMCGLQRPSPGRQVMGTAQGRGSGAMGSETVPSGKTANVYGTRQASPPTSTMAVQLGH